jgi:hypothetical protein
MSSKKLDAAIDALVDALAELPGHELEGWQRGNPARIAHPVRACSALSRHRNGAGSPQVGLSARPLRPPCSQRPRLPANCARLRAP